MAQQEIIHPGPIEQCLLTRQDEHRSQLVWEGKITRGHLRLRSNFKSYWNKVARFPPPPAVIQGIRNAGFFGVYHTATMKHDAGLITAFVDRWRPETHTFHLRFGEATVTVEDVYYILGLHSTGRPVILAEETANVALVHELLGVAPDSEMVSAKGLLHIPWLVDHFGTCVRLEEATGDAYEVELLYHIRAHLLLIIGSLFPNSSGNRIPMRLLPYVRYLDEIRTYSWGSACLAFLYSHLCSASIGDVAELSGSMTLLQVWIYEHCTGLAPRQRDRYMMQHPRALRWMVPLTAVDVPTNSVRGARYELDTMNEASFKWRPYLDSAPDAMMISDHDRALMTAPCPLIYMETVEWCYTDRVSRQFGFLQTIPTTSPHPGHCSFHRSRRHWHLTPERVIDIWESRHEQIMAPPRYSPIVLPACVDQYLLWYDRVTRRYIINPRIWSREDGFQGSQRHMPLAAEGMSNAYHNIYSSGMASEDAQVDDALHGMHSTLHSTSFSELQETPPPPSPIRGCTRPRTRRSGKERTEVVCKPEQKIKKCKTDYKRKKSQRGHQLGPQQQQEDHLVTPITSGHKDQTEHALIKFEGVEVIPLDICSSPEQTKPEVDLLSWLEPVSKVRFPIKVPQESLRKLVDAAVVFKDALVAYLEETAHNLDIADMVQHANECFTKLRTLEVDYGPYHSEVCTFIRNHLELKEAANEKNTLASRLRTDYENSVVNADDLKELLLGAKSKLISAQTNNNLTRTKIEELTATLGRLKKVDDMERDGIAALTAERDHCNEAYLLAEKTVEETGSRLERINERYDVAEQETQRSLGRLQDMVGN